MTSSADPVTGSPPARVSGPVALLSWLIPALLWLYYLTPLLVPGSSPSVALVIMLTVPGAVAIGLLFLRHRQPVLVATLTGLLLALSPGALGAAAVAQSELARRHGRSAVVLMSGGWMIAAKLLGLLLSPYGGGWRQASSFELSLAIAAVVIATLAGRLSGSRAAESRTRHDLELVRREAEEARIERARMGERERIAREMHDVLAHRLSLVAMHAGALTYRTDLTDRQSQQTAELIRSNARQSLDELRAVLSSLRGPEQVPEPPQPGLTEVPVLVADAREGQPVDLDLDVAPASVPQELSRPAYRIVQEALTNARKHAPGAPVRISIAGSAGSALSITVENPRTDLAVADTSGSGLGLIGITERAAVLGGTVDHGFRDHHFMLVVSLPWKEKS